MLIATDWIGQRVQADRDLDPGRFMCPLCESVVILKRGRKVAAHFAHAPGSDCPAAENESWRHIRAKQVLVEAFTELGYDAQMEVVHHEAGRRVDVAVKLAGSKGRQRNVAVEVQDSPIQVDTMQARGRLDRALGYDATAWIFTSHRADALLRAEPGRSQVRVPKEMLWVVDRTGQGMHIIDPEAQSIRRIEFGSVYREGRSYGELEGSDYLGYTPKTIKTVQRHQGGFRIKGVRGRSEKEWAILFA